MPLPIRELGTGKMSLPAQRALNRLHESHALNQLIISDSERNDASLPPLTNRRFNESLEYYLGSQQLIHAADTLNSYCQTILALILQNSDQAWETTKLAFGKNPDRAALIAELSLNDANGGKVRQTLQDKLGILWPGESEVILKLRNKFVHQNGHDPERAVEKTIIKNQDNWCDLPPTDLFGASMPVHYIENDWLAAGASLGHWACCHTRNHIHLADQQICHAYNVPRERWRPRPVSRTFSSDRSHQASTPVLPANEEKASQTASLSAPTPKASQSMKVSENDIKCAQQWQTWQKAFGAAAEGYINELNLELEAQENRIVGLILPHTLAGQERSFSWTVRPSDSQKIETICIRLREKNLSPFITIWGTSSTLRDFSSGEEAPALEYLKDCIDKTLTRNG